MVLDKTILSNITHTHKDKYIAFRYQLKENQTTIHNPREYRQQRETYMNLNSKEKRLDLLTKLGAWGLWESEEGERGGRKEAQKMYSIVKRKK